MGYESWPIKNLSPTSVSLDQENPRLPGLPADASQAEIREEMFRIAKVREMVKSIAKGGFFPDQPIVVIKNDKGHYVVIEGNRRVCACQCLVKPALAPDNQSRWLARWVDAAEPYLGSVRKMRAVVAPSREAATRLIVSKHMNVAPVNGWSRYAQGKFAINEFREGKDIGYVAESTGMSESDVRKNIQLARLFDVFLALDWSEADHAIILENMEKFPIEALLRVLNSSHTHRMIGEVTYKDDGWPQFKWEKGKIEPLLKRLVVDALPALSGESKARLTSRTINKHEDVVPYLEGLPEELLPRKAGRATSAEKIIDQEKLAEQAPGVPAEPPTKKKRKKSARVMPLLSEEIESSLRNKKVACLLEEAQTIKPETLPHASAMLLRSLLEITLIQRLKKSGSLANCMAENGVSKGSMPRLEQMIKFAAKSETALPDVNLRKALQNDQTTSRLLMNLVAHNDKHVLAPVQVRDIAARLEPLLTDLLS